MINGKQNIKLKSGSISFKKYYPFKIYADFECIQKGVESSNNNNCSHMEKYCIACSFCIQRCAY